MRKNKKKPKSYTMLILTVGLGVMVLGGALVLALSYTGVISGDVTGAGQFMPKP